MQRDLNSKLIESFVYDEEDQLLRLHLTSGQIRVYRDVPKDIVEGLARSLSPGSFYIENIRHKFSAE
ncbi:KTSC domain-containing protein [Rhizobium sp. 007]|uniref:KTSC domain-containing protein n=1 Tax=Rhizobium sp. 007 TaxID=2785056 RepID=UPI00188FCDB6|nr:KTSC domain-containing protein [Rhizobium sp. 007]QPB22389.1 KTSC domain-containing protein [Rhizobium sp. 007]